MLAALCLIQMSLTFGLHGWVESTTLGPMQGPEPMVIGATPSLYRKGNQSLEKLCPVGVEE